MTEIRPTVSVIVPVFNVEPFLGECLQSVISQDFDSFEVICVDDGSTDGSFRVLKRFSDEDCRIKVFQVPHGGLARARNYGMDCASGMYVMFLDSDDALMPHAIRCAVSVMMSESLDVLTYEAVAFSTHHISPATKGACDSSSQPAARSGIDFLTHQAFQGRWDPSVCLYMTRFDCLRKPPLKFKDGIAHEDNLFTLQLLLRADRVAALGGPLYAGRARQGSITRSPVTPWRVWGLLESHSMGISATAVQSKRLSRSQRLALHFVLANIANQAHQLKSQMTHWNLKALNRQFHRRRELLSLATRVIFHSRIISSLVFGVVKLLMLLAKSRALLS